AIPAPVPGFEVELLAQPRLDHQQLPRKAGGDSVVERRRRLQVEPQLRPPAVRVPPRIEMQLWVIEIPLRLARANAMVDLLQAGRQRSLHRSGQRPKKSSCPHEPALVSGASHLTRGRGTT